MNMTNYFLVAYAACVLYVIWFVPHGRRQAEETIDELHPELGREGRDAAIATATLACAVLAPVVVAAHLCCVLSWLAGAARRP